MRTRYIVSAALLVLASASVADAQQKAAAPAKPAWEQQWELGFRSTTTTGDEARYMRYEDLKSGLASKIALGKETDAVAYDFSAANVGYDDQAFAFSYNRYGKAKFNLSFNGQPLNYAFNTLTPFRDAGNNKWTLDPTLRTRVQNKEAGVLGIGTTGAQYNTASIYRSIATEFPMSAQRNTLDLGLKYTVNKYAAVDFSYKMVQKSGNQPWGAAFAFSDANELPMTLDNGVNEITAGIEFAKSEYGMFRAEYQGSFFKQNLPTLEWDNPLRATDFSNGKTPPAGPWDPSGYSNGNGPAFGRMSMAPSSALNALNLKALYKMPNHTTLNGSFTILRMTQDDDLIPWTTNTSIAQAATYAFFPGLAKLHRPTAEGQVDGINAVINFTTRPTNYFAFDMKYRFNDHDNQTTPWDGVEYVRFDAVPEETGGESEGLDIRQSTVETGATFSLPGRGTALRLGYILDDVKRSGRAFSDMTDYTFRASLDAYQNQWFSLRGLLESTRRIGSGLSIEHIEEGGGQEELRFYDEADMDRIKSSVILGLTPSSKFDLNLTVGTMNDEYAGEGHEFGLLKYDNTSVSLSGNYYVNDKVTFGAMYGADHWTSNQKSRNANPFSATATYNSWSDPLRDWYMDNDETVTNAGVWLDLIQALPKTDLRFAFNFSDSDLEYTLSGPRIEAFKNPDNTALRDPRDGRPCATGISSCFIPWPNVTNTWSQFKVDLRHMFKDNLGVGLGYRYEKFEIVDFATTNIGDTDTPRMDPLGAITTGYGNRPFTGSTAVVKLIYKF